MTNLGVSALFGLLVVASLTAGAVRSEVALAILGGFILGYVVG